MRIDDVCKIIEQSEITDTTSEEEKQAIALFWIVKQLEAVKEQLYDAASALRAAQGQPIRPREDT